MLNRFYIKDNFWIEPEIFTFSSLQSTQDLKNNRTDTPTATLSITNL